MADQSRNRDALFDKLDSLIKRQRAQPSAEVPVLSRPTQAGTGEGIPTLTEAVSGPGRSRQLSRSELEQAISMRLAESIEREIRNLGVEFPSIASSLDLLGRSMVRSLPALAHIACADAPDKPAPADGSAPQPADSED